MHTININLCIMAEKESYSEEELNEMIVWFNNHADELPKEMQINKAAFTPDLKLTVESCIMQAKQCLGNYKMAGAFRMLQQIRENLEKAVQYAALHLPFHHIGVKNIINNPTVNIINYGKIFFYV